MTTLTDTQVITASGGLVELGYLAYNSGNVAVTAGTNSYIGGTLTCVCDGSPILVETYVPRVDMAATADQWVQVEIDGVSQGRVVAGYNPGTQQTAGPTHGRLRVTPSAGSHTFRMRAYSYNATTTYLSGGGVFPDAFLRVSKIVQATQWPAVTTGTIICTSSTRPASPFAGQKIYETDTKKELTYDGTSWTQPWNQPWGVIGIGTHDTGAGVSSGVSICSVTFTAVTGRMYLASYVSRTVWAGGSATVGIYDNNTGLRIAEDYGAPSPVVLQRAKTFSAGSRTLSIRQDGATTMTPISGSYSGHERPAQLVVTDIGPA